MFQLFGPSIKPFYPNIYKGDRSCDDKLLHLATSDQRGKSHLAWWQWECCWVGGSTYGEFSNILRPKTVLTLGQHQIISFAQRCLGSERVKMVLPSAQQNSPTADKVRTLPQDSNLAHKVVQSYHHVSQIWARIWACLHRDSQRCSCTRHYTYSPKISKPTKEMMVRIPRCLTVPSCCTNKSTLEFWNFWSTN